MAPRRLTPGLSLLAILLASATSLVCNGCLSLYDYSRTLASEEPPWFLSLTADKRFAPGNGTWFPRRPFHPWPLYSVFAECGLEAICGETTRTAFIDLRRPLWIDLSRDLADERLGSDEFLRDLEFFRRARYAVLRIRNPSWLFLEPAETTRRYWNTHPRPGSDALSPCLAQLDTLEGHILESVIVAHLSIEFRSSLLVRMDLADVVNDVQRLGIVRDFKWNHEKRSLDSRGDWVVATRARLRLTREGIYFLADYPERSLDWLHLPASERGYRACS